MGFVASGIWRSQAPALAGFRPALRQRIQPMTLLGGEPIG
jgi:hypothetical protein